MTETLRLRPSRRKWTLMLIGSIAFAAGGIGLLFTGDPWGWAALGFAALGVPLSILVLRGRWNRLDLTPHGFTLHTVHSKMIAWDDVVEFGTFDVPHGTLVNFRFVDDYPQSELERVVSSVSDLEGGALPDTYGMEAEELAALMEDWRVRHSTRARPEPMAARRA